MNLLNEVLMKNLVKTLKEYREKTNKNPDMVRINPNLLPDSFFLLPPTRALKFEGIPVMLDKRIDKFKMIPEIDRNIYEVRAELYEDLLMKTEGGQ